MTEHMTVGMFLDQINLDDPKHDIRNYTFLVEHDGSPPSFESPWAISVDHEERTVSVL